MKLYSGVIYIFPISISIMGVVQIINGGDTLLLLSGLMFCFVLHVSNRAFDHTLEYIRRSMNQVADDIPRAPKITQIPEFNHIMFAIYNYAKRAHSQQNVQRHTSQSLWDMAHTDELTDIGNLRRLNAEIDSLLSSSIQYTRMPVSYAIIDVNKFKHINDTFGHNRGDDVLKDVARVLKKVIRNGDHVYRIGGDEFVVLFLDTVLSDAEIIMRRCLSNLYFGNAGGHDFSVNLSIGISTINGPFLKEHFVTLKEKADAALYNAKGQDDSVISDDSIALAEYNVGLLGGR